MTAYQKSLVLGNLSLDVPQYTALQCQTGYQGLGSCVVCTHTWWLHLRCFRDACPDYWLNTSYYFLVALVNLVLVAISIRGSLEAAKK
ncbi:hypothetical protein HaLaN_22532, partial [Haematococcus lacustris]